MKSIKEKRDNIEIKKTYQLADDYDSLVYQINQLADETEDYTKIKQLEDERKRLKSQLIEEINLALTFNNKNLPAYGYIDQLCRDILLQKYNQEVYLDENIISAYRYARDIFNQNTLSGSRHELGDSDKEFSRREFKRLMPVYEKYWLMQNIVNDKNKREPSLLEAVAATTMLKSTREKLREDVQDQAEAIVVAGSSVWGAYFDTRGFAKKRLMVNQHWQYGDLAWQLTEKTKSEEKKVEIKPAVNEPSDIDMIIVAKPDNNIGRIYRSIVANHKIDRSVRENNERIIKKFEEALAADLSLAEKPVSINIDFFDDNGFVTQLIIFSHDGFKNLYRTEIGELENIYRQDDREKPIFGKRIQTEVTDLENGLISVLDAYMFYHRNLDYMEGTKAEIKKKVAAKKYFSQALIGGKLIKGEYTTEIFGEADLIDENKDIYGQFLIKNYPFGGFLLEENKKFGNYFLGFNPDNLVSGQNFTTQRENNEISEIMDGFRQKYFYRILTELLANGWTGRDILASDPDLIFGPYLSRWPRMPVNFKKDLFNSFRDFIKADIARTDSNYYFASRLDHQSRINLTEWGDRMAEMFPELIAQPPDKLHKTEYYYHSLDDINRILAMGGSRAKLELADFRLALQTVIARQFLPREMQIEDVSFFGDNLVIQLKRDKTADAVNRLARTELEKVLIKSGVSKEQIDYLYSHPDFTWQYLTEADYTPHVTIAKLVDSKIKPDLDLIKKRMKTLIGQKIYFNRLILSKNNNRGDDEL